MRVTMSYLGSLEQLWMQHISKWYYATGAGRVQTSISLVRPAYFSAFDGSRSNKNLFAYTTGSDVAKLTCGNKDDYISHRWYSCQVGLRKVFQV